MQTGDEGIVASVDVVRARIEPEIKRDATVALAAMGLTVSEAIRLMLVRVAKEKALPFEVRTPNWTTRAAVEAAVRGEVTEISTVEALFAELDK